MPKARALTEGCGSAPVTSREEERITRRIQQLQESLPPDPAQPLVQEIADGVWWVKTKNQALEEAITRLEDLLKDERALRGYTDARIEGTLRVLRKGLSL